jgi:hypothetical protein
MTEFQPQKCSICQRERTLGDGEYQMDSYDYSPIQVVTGKPLGWYSGDDGEVCPEDMAKMIRNQ